LIEDAKEEIQSIGNELMKNVKNIIPILKKNVSYLKEETLQIECFLKSIVEKNDKWIDELNIDIDGVQDLIESNEKFKEMSFHLCHQLQNVHKNYFEFPKDRKAKIQSILDLLLNELSLKINVLDMNESRPVEKKPESSDTTVVEEKDIELVSAQCSDATREQIIASLKANNMDIVNTIMELIEYEQNK
jgi:NACalpha-BTF3-like transcription factor